MPKLYWTGKDRIENYHNEVPFHFLDKKYSHGRKTGNLIIHGDNLTALKSLEQKFAGKIKCIYIDPPYNTGNEGWIYNDNVNDEQINKWLGQVVGKEGEDLTRHDKWLCMMFPRLQLLKNLLADDGAIFISIDDNEQASLKLMCDEIFGIDNFVANIAVINNFKGRSDDKYIATAHESLLIYRGNNFVTNGVPIPEEYVKEYKLADDDGNYRLQGLRKRGANSRREDRPNMFYPFYYNERQKILSLDKSDDSTEILPHLSDGSDGRWRWGKDTARERISELIVQRVKGRGEYDVFQKDYLPTNGMRRVKPKSFWMGTEFSAEAGTLMLKNIFGEKIFNNPKPVGIIEYILRQATGKDSIVLDAFAGSGTTAHAVINLNQLDHGTRRFILIELNDYAETITAERVRRIGGSFDFYEIGAALFEKDGSLNAGAPLEQIREYIWYSETGKENPPCSADEKYLLGVDGDTAYYFCWEPNESCVLDWAFLSTIKTQAENYVVYAGNCLLSEEQLEEHNVTFRQIPNDVRKF